MSSVVLRTAARFMLPLLLLFSLFLLIRGHNEPGGGFSGGLVAAAAFTLYMVAVDAEGTRRVLGVDPRMLIGGGRLAALLGAVIGLTLGQPLLSGVWVDLPLPDGSYIALGTPFIFDIGVYLLVLGVTLTIVLALAEES
jgi:multicomponent Na+:H+ antiporter subunit B